MFFLRMMHFVTSLGRNGACCICRTSRSAHTLRYFDFVFQTILLFQRHFSKKLYIHVPQYKLFSLRCNALSCACPYGNSSSALRSPERIALIPLRISGLRPKPTNAAFQGEQQSCCRNGGVSPLPELRPRSCTAAPFFEKHREGVC